MRKLFFEVKQFFVFSFRLLYVFISGGRKCAVCGRLVFTKPICTACMKHYFRTESILEKERCECCGKELISMKGRCMICRENPVLVSTDGVIPLFSYRLWNRELMFRWKSQEEREFSPIFARLLYEGLRKTGDRVLVPVPPRKGKIRKKGWDQIEELCSIIHHRYKRPILRLLKRVSSQQQKKLDRKGRLLLGSSSYKENAKNLKKVAKSGSLPVEALLLDDVMTTGATVEACAGVLKGMGIRKVQVITLFIVD